uniref:Myosin phosphatase Rho interacting protein n=1 Tax=Sander lucioperca TaxID=283035 RepID=A0A8D0A9M3_SANLU
MSFKDNPCRKFQANIFNKSKCQNCFKPRESHLLNDEDLNQAKPIYGGWLLLAPEGTNFDNPLHRSRKWQRRFFILYEHGLLRYALDEMPSTLPQGTINMNQCSDVIDGESRTGQKNSLCILTPEKEHFIRAECKEIINGWQEALTVYPRTNKQNQKKKRKVDAPTQQEPGPAKVTVTSSGGSIPCLPSSIASAERVPLSRATLWQEESRWSRHYIQTVLGVSYWWHCVLASDGGTISTGRKVRVESGYFSLEKTKSEPSPQHSHPPHYSTISSSQSSLDSEPSGTTPTWEGRSGGGGSIGSVSGGDGRLGRSGREYTALSDVPRARRLSYREAFRSEKKRQELRARTRSPGREEVARLFGQERKDRSVPDVSSTTFANLRRAKSLDRRVTESSMTPDLLNFKKGWMTKLYEDGMWKKHWFVLTDQSLRYYKDSIAEEASELDGEIDLSACYDVKEFPVQRNYGFQILCKEGVCTLSAMTSGIRRNWIQAIMKNVRPTIAPDVTRSFPEEKTKLACNNASAPPSEPLKSQVRERRREGRSKTFDWSEFKMEQTEKPAKERADTVDLSSSFSTTSSYCSPSSSPSSIASSPVSTSSIQTSSVSGARPPSMTVEAEKENVMRGEEKDSRTSGVREEIEQRWHQVETTPLREEKQVPINTASGNSGNSDRLPAHELAALLDKELGQKQQELDRLQKQNNVLKEQLEDALGREQSARAGYVLQSATPSSSMVPWQRLHKLNEDLQGELETQKRKQDLAQQQIRTLKRSYTEAQHAVDHHESGIQALQAKLASAMAEILASEQAVARMRNELKLEQERSKEQEEEYGRGEATLRAQLKDSEERLREVEASLLERSQALRHLERQQALQRDHTREIQRLQEMLQEVTARQSATEKGQALKEERLRKEQYSMQESHERERQNLCRRLAEAETAQKEMENRLLEAKQQVEALLRGRQASGGKECSEEILKLQEELAQKTDMVESLRESVRRLEEEKSHLTCRCQELLNQIAEADREVNKLRNRLETEEADYYTLEHSYERATQEFQKMSQFLREKEEEIRQTKEMYERLVERKEEDLKEALVKMAALGNSLEETEQKLQAKEELLCQMNQSILDKAEPCSAEKDLQAKLVVAEDRIAELEQHLNALQLGYADLRMERQQIPDQKNSPDDKESQAKRPRIRFSSIHCQKYINLEGLDTSHVSTAFADTRQTVNQDVDEDIHLSEGNLSSDIPFSHSSDPEKFISIVHSLETKLLATEDKLRHLTQNLEEQRSIQAEDMSKIDLKMTETKPNANKDFSCGSGIQSSSANKHYAKALVCVENSREKVRTILSGSHDTTGSQLHSLSEIENDLFNASLYIRQGQKTLEEQSPVVHQNQIPETLDKEALHLFAKTLSFEAIVLNKMALLIQTSKSELLQSLAEIWEDMENIKRGDKDCLAIVYADVLTRKLMLESAFWKELEKAEMDVAKSKEGSVSADVDVDTTVIFNTFIKAELAYSIQNLKLCYEEKFQILKREHLAGEMPSCGVDSIESLQNAHDNLANELQRQALILHKYAQEIESGGNHPGLAKMIHALLGHQTSHHFTSTSLCMREALIQAQVAYVACRLRAMHEQDLGWCKQTGQNMDDLVQQHARNVSAIQEKYEASLQDEHLNFTQTQELSQAEKGRVSTDLALMETTADSQRKLEVLLVDIDTMEERHEGHVRKLEEQFEQRICELQHIHEQEIEKLHSEFMENIQCIQKHQQDEKGPGVSDSPPCDEVATPMEEEEQGKEEDAQIMSEVDSMVVLKDRIQELEAQMSTMKDELESKHLEGDVASLREKYQRDFESLKATCERGFAAMEDTHQKLIHDLQRQHQREISKLMEERERLLAEETAATIAAIEAMKNAHKEELEKTHRSQLSGLNSDIDELRLQYEEELQSIHRELEVLSEQYSQKCLENAHLAQALEAERQALRQCQRENQELNAHNQELNNRLTTEITRMRSCFSGETALSPLTQGKDVYELEVLLRIKESEIQYLKQEIHSLKDELQSALRDKKYATDKYKDIYTELSIVKAKADCDICKLKEKLLIATEALGERTVDGTVTSGYDIMKSKSNPDFLKKERSTTSKQSRGIRSKVSVKFNKTFFFPNYRHFVSNSNIWSKN